MQNKMCVACLPVRRYGGKGYAEGIPCVIVIIIIIERTRLSLHYQSLIVSLRKHVCRLKGVTIEYGQGNVTSTWDTNATVHLPYYSLYKYLSV